MKNLNIIVLEYKTYSMRDYREECDYIANAPSMSEVIAEEMCNLREEWAFLDSLENDRLYRKEAEATLRNAQETFSQMLALMNSQPSFENYVGLMGAYNMVSDYSKDVYGFRCRPFVNLTNPVAIAIRECVAKVPLEKWLVYEESVYAKHQA